jgi:transcriptional regulator of arginine metabolism
VTLGGSTKARRQQAIRELIARHPVASQTELARLLAERGLPATQATVSRDVAQMNLVRVARNGRHAWVSPDDVAPPPPSAGDERLRRILTDIPVRIGRSGLILVLTGSPGTASAIAQAIDDSTLDEQEGTLAGDNTLLVLFADERRLIRWRERFRRLQGRGGPASGPSPAIARPASHEPRTIDVPTPSR